VLANTIKIKIYANQGLMLTYGTNFASIVLDGWSWINGHITVADAKN
jgi:hypothetical protein